MQVKIPLTEGQYQLLSRQREMRDRQAELYRLECRFFDDIVSSIAMDGKVPFGSAFSGVRMYREDEKWLLDLNIVSDNIPESKP